MKENLDNFNDKISILLIEDDEETRYLNEKEIKMIFGHHRKDQLRFRHAGTIEEALEIASSDTFNLIITDHDLGSSTGGKSTFALEHIDRLSELQFNAKFLVLTGFNNNPILASEYMSKEAVVGFTTKGETEGEIQYRTTMIVRALNDAQYKIEQEKKKYLGNSKLTLQKYKSKAMREIYTKLKALAEVNSPVLIIGEPGTGKSHLAQQLNEMTKLHKKQNSRVFIDKNMGAISENLIEAELFGAEAGSYTGANKRRIGLFEVANDGTFFLDEIGEASPSLQVKLLKAIGDKKIMRVGGNEEIHVNPRLIFATNRNLEKLIEDGLFRQDLYDRIKTFTIKMPSLNDRREDIPFICEDICESIRKSEEIGIYYKDFELSLQDYLINAKYKGNVRELYGKILTLAVQSKKRPSGKIIYSDWRRVLGVTEEVKGNEHLSSKDYNDFLESLSRMIVEKDSFGLGKVKDDLEFKAFKYLMKNSEDKITCDEIGKVFGLSRTTAHKKLKDYMDRDSKKRTVK